MLNKIEKTRKIHESRIAKGKHTTKNTCTQKNMQHRTRGTERQNCNNMIQDLLTNLTIVHFFNTDLTYQNFLD